jgi:HPt (histidine-containing phosphotransfer) domain-containing protein
VTGESQVSVEGAGVAPPLDLKEFSMSAAASQDRAIVYSEFANDPEYRELLELFDEAVPERQRCLIEAFRAGRIPELQTLAHQLKGAGGGFGFPGLTDRAADLEAACKQGGPDRIAAELDRMLTYLQRIAV